MPRHDQNKDAPKESYIVQLIAGIIKSPDDIPKQCVFIEPCVARTSSFLRTLIISPPRGEHKLQVELPNVEHKALKRYVDWLRMGSISFPEPSIFAPTVAEPKTLLWRECIPLIETHMLGSRFGDAEFEGYVITQLERWLRPGQAPDYEVLEFVFAEVDAAVNLKTFVVERMFGLASIVERMFGLEEVLLEFGRRELQSKSGGGSERQLGATSPRQPPSFASRQKAHGESPECRMGEEAIAGEHRRVANGERIRHTHFGDARRRPTFQKTVGKVKSMKALWSSSSTLPPSHPFGSIGRGTGFDRHLQQPRFLPPSPKIHRGILQALAIPELDAHEVPAVGSAHAVAQPQVAGEAAANSGSVPFPPTPYVENATSHRPVQASVISRTPVPVRPESRASGTSSQNRCESPLVGNARSGIIKRKPAPQRGIDWVKDSMQSKTPVPPSVQDLSSKVHRRTIGPPSGPVELHGRPVRVEELRRAEKRPDTA